MISVDSNVLHECHDYDEKINNEERVPTKTSRFDFQEAYCIQQMQVFYFSRER